MANFPGSADEFRQAIDAHELRGTWQEFAQGLRYKTADGGTIQWYASTKTVLVQGSKAVKEKLDALVNELQVPVAPSIPVVQTVAKGVKSSGRIFLVHGHDHISRDQLELIIHKLGLEPFVLANSSGEGLTIIEALEKEIGRDGTSVFGIVLLTPDDMGYSVADGADKAQPRARQNVILEMGMLMAAVGRRNTVILQKGKLETPSDASGTLSLKFNQHVKEVVPRLVERLQLSGFEIETRRITNAAS